MLYNGGNTGDLFRAAFMQSGSPLPAGSMEQGQKYYDFTVRQVGCSTAADTLECLRTVPYDKLKATFDALPGLFSYQVCAISLSGRPTVADAFQVNNIGVCPPRRRCLPGRQTATFGLT